MEGPPGGGLSAAPPPLSLRAQILATLDRVNIPLLTSALAFGIAACSGSSNGTGAAGTTGGTAGTSAAGSQIVSVQGGHTLVASVTAPRGARRGSAFAVVITPLAGSGPFYAARVETQGQDTVVSILPAVSALTTISLPPVRRSYDAVSPP